MHTYLCIDIYVQTLTVFARFVWVGSCMAGHEDFVATMLKYTSFSTPAARPDLLLCNLAVICLGILFCFHYNITIRN